VQTILSFFGHFTSITLTLEGSLQMRTNLQRGCFTQGFFCLLQQDEDMFYLPLKYFFRANSSEDVNLLAESEETRYRGISLDRGVKRLPSYLAGNLEISYVVI